MNAASIAMFTAAVTLGADAQNQVLEPIRFLKKTVELHVQDADGRPIQEFEYTTNASTATLQRRADGSLPQLRHVSDPLGIARIELRPRYYKGAWKVTVAIGAPGCVMKFHTIEPERLTKSIVVLERAGRVFGKVIDSAGNPIAGARIWIGEVPYPGHHGRSAHIMESDSSGEIESDRIPIGKTKFGIYHPDFVADVYEREVSDDAVNNFSFVMVGAATLQGSIFLGSYSPERARVSISINDGNGSADVSGYTWGRYEDGNFVAKGIVPGPNRVLFRASQPRTGFSDRYWTVTEDITFAEGDQRTVDVRIPMGTCSVAGSLLLEGAPLTHGNSVYVTLTRQNATDALRVGMAPNDDGDYVFDGVPSGTWVIRARAWDDQAKKLYQFENQFSLVDGEALRFDFDLPEIEYRDAEE